MIKVYAELITPNPYTSIKKYPLMVKTVFNFIRIYI